MLRAMARRVIVALEAVGTVGMALGAGPTVAIRTDFPGGNVVVVKAEPGAVQLAPDLRGGMPWFYWYFEATADRPGRVNFIFPEKVAGFVNGAIGYQGPAVSHDHGRTWQWMGTDDVQGNAFRYQFTKANEKVRLAVTMPYVEADYARFIKGHAANPHLARSVLTKSLKGRPVELVQIGKPGPGVRAVLLVCRHHACETMASFVFEGFLAAALSDTPAAVEFRRKYVLYAVPFVDRDGVEDGDQGKNRKPHDHNRDYGEGSLYPEIDAIEKLADSRNIQFLQDFHCPTLRMEDHQVMYFVGSKDTPAGNEENVRKYARMIKEGLPPNSPHGPLVWLQKRAAKAAGDNCNDHFAFREGAIMASTIEIPFAPPKATMNATQARGIGQAMLKAWAKMEFAGGHGGTPAMEGRGAGGDGDKAEAHASAHMLPDASGPGRRLEH